MLLYILVIESGSIIVALHSFRKNDVYMEHMAHMLGFGSAIAFVLGGNAFGG